MEVDKAASVPRFLALAFGSVPTTSLRSVGVVCGGFIGVVDDGGFIWELGMAEDWDKMAKKLRRHVPR